MSDSNVEGFEATLRDRPDDLAAWSAYADYLAERDDPRGEFMRVQLALEDETLTRDDRTALRRRETELLLAHRRDWLGAKLYDALFTRAGKPRHHWNAAKFRRGWVWELENVEIDAWEAAEFATFHELRWVQRWQQSYVEGGLGQYTTAPFAPVLRAFEYGGEEENSGGSADGLEDLLPAFPRLEKLWLAAYDTVTEAVFAAPMPSLRELSVHCIDIYRTDVLAANPTLVNLRSFEARPHHYRDDADAGAYLTAEHLTHIARSPHLKGLTRLRLNSCNAGNEAFAILAASGLLFRLESLDLSDGAVNDAGAVALARVLRKTAHKLKLLRLENNGLTATGVAALRAAGVTIEAPRQHRPGSTDYLYTGDFE